jgi:hypothetical protein
VAGDQPAQSFKVTLLLGAARVLVPAAILGVFALLVAGVIPGSGWTWLVAGVLFGAFLVAAREQKPEPERAHADAARGVLGAAAFLLSASLFYYLLCRLTAAHWSLEFAPVVVLLVALTAAGAIVLGLPRLRPFVLDEAGVLGPFALLAVMFVVMTSAFAAFTVVAAREGLITLAASSSAPSFEDVSQLYVWQFCKSVPLLDVNQTLRWEPPFVYAGSGTGTFVLLYKLAVIVPLIGAFLAYWTAQIELKKPAEA